MNFSTINLDNPTPVSRYINDPARYDIPILYIVRSVDTAKTDWSVSFVYYQNEPLHCDSDARLGRAMRCTIVRGIESDGVLPYKGIATKRVFF